MTSAASNTVTAPSPKTPDGALRHDYMSVIEEDPKIRRLRLLHHSHGRIVAEGGEEDEIEKTCPTEPISSCMELEYTYGMNHGECQCSERYGEGIFECRQNGNKHGIVWCQGQLSKTQSFLIGSKNKGGSSTASLSRTVPSPPTPKIQQGDYITESVGEKTIEEKIYRMGIGNIMIAVGGIVIMGLVLIVVMVIRSRRRQTKQQQRQLHDVRPDTMSLDFDDNYHNPQSDLNILDDDSDDSNECGMDDKNGNDSRSSDKMVEMATLA